MKLQLEILMPQPNIIFYFSDQQRADTCGCYGQQLNITPQLDKFAAEGVKFEHAFTPQPVCGPCRSLFQTGLYPTSTGCFRNNVALPRNSKTLGHYFESAGYETAYVGKWHLASDGELETKPHLDFHDSPIPPEHRGGYTGFWRASDVLEFTSDGFGGYVFDEDMNKLEFSGYRADCITDYALEFLEKRSKSKPFFLTVSHIEPHHQNNAGHYQGPRGSKEKYKDCELPADLQLDKGDAREEYPDYLGACESVDRNFGRIIQALKDEGIYDDTVIIFTSDHGSHFRTRNNDTHKNGYDDYKRSGHDASIRVPLVIRGGKYLGGKEVRDLVSTASLPKTILSMAGIQEEIPMIGEDLISVVEGNTKRRNEVFVQVSESRVGRVIRTEDFTYAVYAPDKNGGLHMDSSVYADDYLYDLKNDPHQQHDVKEQEEHQEIKRYLRQRLLDWIAETENKGDRSRVQIID